MAKYLITGGCGFIGSHLCDALIAQGHDIVVLDNLSTCNSNFLPPKASFIEGDIQDPATVKKAMHNMDGCFHLAAIASVELSTKQWLATHRTNLSATINVFDMARTANHGKPTPVVYASSAAVYGNDTDLPLNELRPSVPLTAYGADKLGCELHARIAHHVHSVPTLGLRFFNVYGLRQDPNSPYSGVISKFFEHIANDQAIEIQGDGEQSRDFIYVADVVRMLTKAMEHPQKQAEVYNVCTGEAVSINQVAETISRLLQKPLRKNNVTTRVGDITNSVGDPNRAIEKFKIKADTGLQEGLSNMLNYHHDNKDGSRILTATKHESAKWQ